MSVESTRVTNETARVLEENTRITNETARVSAESIRGINETSRIDLYNVIQNKLDTGQLEGDQGIQGNTDYPGVSSQDIINFHRNNNVLTCLAHTNWVGAYVLKLE